MAAATNSGNVSRNAMPATTETPKKKKERKPSPFPILDFQMRLRRLVLKQIIQGTFTADQMKGSLVNVANELAIIGENK